MQTFSLSVREDSPAVLTAYLHDLSPEMPARSPRPAMLVLPGGGYAFCSDREAEPVALDWFAQGYNVFVLRYTVISEAHPAPLYLQPLQDAAAALSLLRCRAAAWKLQPDHIAVIGFSAGGHLAASLAVHAGDPRLAPHCRPDAVVLGYPVISCRENCGIGNVYADEPLTAGEADWLHFFACEENVTADTPPAFVWATCTDNAVDPLHSLRFVQALHAAAVPCELHLFDHGLHGYSLASAETGNPDLPADAGLGCWCTLAHRWLGDLFGWRA